MAFDDKKANLKMMVKNIYQIQKLRIQIGLRIVAMFKKKLGILPGQKEDSPDIDDMSKEMLEELKTEYDLITDAIVDNIRNKHKVETYKTSRYIKTYAEYALVNSYFSIRDDEAVLFKALERPLLEFEIYNSFLSKVKGCGPAMAAIIISTIDIHKATYASTIHAYAGLDVAADGKGRGKTKAHLVKREYTDAEGKLQLKDSVTFNPFLKTKLLAVLGGAFLKCGSPYRQSYDNYKHRLQNRVDTKDFTKGHIHNMAIRYMVKRFLADLYENWRALENLPVYNPYEADKLGMKPHTGGVVNDISKRA